MQLIQETVESARLQAWYPLVALWLTFAVQLLRKHPSLKQLIWEKIPDGLRFAVPLVGGAVAGFVGAHANGAGLIDALNAALGGALSIGLGSMGLAAGLRESPLPWDGSSGGKPKPPKSDDPPNDQKPVGLSTLALAMVLTGCGLFGDPESAADKACPEATRVATVECPALAVAGCGGKPWAECAEREKIEAECHARIEAALEACE
jgi:hypothetical protein